MIAEENLEESSPERPPPKQRLSQPQISKKNSRQQEDVSLNNEGDSHDSSTNPTRVVAVRQRRGAHHHAHLANQREGRESQKDVLSKLPLVEIGHNHNAPSAIKRISLPSAAASNI